MVENISDQGGQYLNKWVLSINFGNFVKLLSNYGCWLCQFLHSPRNWIIIKSTTNIKYECDDNIIKRAIYVERFHSNNRKKYNFGNFVKLFCSTTMYLYSFHEFFKFIILGWPISQKINEKLSPTSFLYGQWSYPISRQFSYSRTYH